MTRRRLTALVLALLAVAAGVVLTVVGDTAALWAWIAETHGIIESYAAAHPVPAALVFLAVATFGKVTPFPGGLLIMLVGGTLFGPVVGPLLAAAGAALCALLVGAAGRALIREAIHRRFGHRIAHLEDTMAREGFNWLLAARLLPVLPAWLVNLVPVVFPVALWKVFVATLAGLIPISFVVGGIGAGLSDMAEARTVPADILFAPGVLGPLAALALLALAPVAVRRLRRRKTTAPPPPSPPAPPQQRREEPPPRGD